MAMFVETYSMENSEAFEEPYEHNGSNDDYETELIEPRFSV